MQRGVLKGSSHGIGFLQYLHIGGRPTTASTIELTNSTVPLRNSVSRAATSRIASATSPRIWSTSAAAATSMVSRRSCSIASCLAAWRYPRRRR